MLMDHRILVVYIILLLQLALTDHFWRRVLLFLALQVSFGVRTVASLAGFLTQSLTVAYAFRPVTGSYATASKSIRENLTFTS